MTGLVDLGYGYGLNWAEVVWWGALAREGVRKRRVVYWRDGRLVNMSGRNPTRTLIVLRDGTAIACSLDSEQLMKRVREG